MIGIAHPLQSLLGMVSVLRGSHPMNMPRALIIVQDLTDRGKEFRDSCPDPLGAIGHYTQPGLVCGNHSRLFDLAQCGKQCLVVLNLKSDASSVFWPVGSVGCVEENYI